ncbi:MAG: hypothetical protein DME69_12850, partial [Verrucomicrobia bacterium]
RGYYGQPQRVGPLFVYNPNAALTNCHSCRFVSAIAPVLYIFRVASSIQISPERKVARYRWPVCCVKWNAGRSLDQV